MDKPDSKKIVDIVLTAVAVGMSVASLVIGFIPEAADAGTQVTLLSIGLAALSISALDKVA